MTIYKNLVADRGSIHKEIEQILEGKAVFDNESHQFVFMERTLKISGKNKILLSLFELAVSQQLGLRESDAAERAEISQRTGLKPDVAGARMKDNRDDGLTESIPRGDRLTLRGLLECKKLIKEIAERGGIDDTD